ncbi:MAG: LysM peptidoglycan-binding domain-containing protein [Streptococcaceae bacterium]|nr:LysM peptidoglycan-binding domain-containing protein [Streptococcaceae bacterium]
MKINNAGLQLIKDFEGCKLSCYHLGDGVCTVGYGTTRPLSLCRGAGSWKISKAEAERLLLSNLASYEKAVSGYFARPLNENQFSALVSFAYNLGGGIFKKYNWSKAEPDKQITGRMIQYVNPEQFRAGLTRRRKAEIALFDTPVSADRFYTVKQGDTLSGIGQKVKIPWQEIASKNGIKSPYTIYPNQKLKL